MWIDSRAIWGNEAVVGALQVVQITLVLLALLVLLVHLVNSVVSIYKWDHKLIIKLANARLRGNARKWYDSLKDACKEWDEMKHLLLQTFPCKIKFGKLFVEAANYVHLSNQKLSDYCFEKLTRLRKLN